MAAGPGFAVVISISVDTEPSDVTRPTDDVSTSFDVATDSVVAALSEVIRVCLEVGSFETTPVDVSASEVIRATDVASTAVVDSGEADVVRSARKKNNH